MGKKGFVLLELLLAILLIEIAILGCSQLFIDGLLLQQNLHKSLEALQYLRGELELIETMNFNHIYTKPLKKVQPGIYYSLNVTAVDQNSNSIPDYKIVKGKVFWKKGDTTQGSYQLVTYIYP